MIQSLHRISRAHPMEGFARRGMSQSRERLLAYFLLLFAVAFNLYQLSPEVTIGAPMLNDGVLHLLALTRTVSALAALQDPTDPWLATIDLGYPLFHYYQHVPDVLPALIYFLFRGFIPLAAFYHWMSYLLLSLFPLSIYWSMRRCGFPRLTAACTGLVAPLIVTNGLYGLEFGSYVWRGYGLYTQLWGMLLLPPTIAQCYATLRQGKGYLWAVLLLVATILSHVVLGYMALVSLILFVIFPVLNRSPLGRARSEVWRRGKRLVLLLVLVALVASYFLIPFQLDNAYMNRSVWELQSKYDSYGYQWVLGTLASGQLFDYGRFPSLTILAGVGLVFCLWRWRREHYRLPVALALVWLALYFGRPTWGVLLNILPMSRDLQLHRLIAGVHLGGIYLMGLGLAIPWRWATLRHKARYLAAAAGLTALFLFPVYQERAAYLTQNARWMQDTHTASVAEEKDISGLITWLRQAPPGRVYAGLAAQWGNSFRVGQVPVYALLQSAGLDTVGYLYHALSLNADIEVLFDEHRPEQYNLFNIRYVVAPSNQVFPAFVRPVKDFGRFRLYTVATTGYFDLAGSNLALAGDKANFYPAAYRWLKSDEPRVKLFPAVFLRAAQVGHAHVFPLSQASTLIPWTVLPAEPPRGRVIAEAVAPNTYAAQIQVQRESLLVLKETYHPNWHATVDGVVVKTVMMMPSYIGVQVGPGTHRILLQYRSGLLRGFLMIVGVLTLALLAVAEWWPETFTPMRRRFGLPSIHLRQRRSLFPVLSLFEHVTFITPIWRSLRAAVPLRGHLAQAHPTSSPKPTSVDVRTKTGIYLLFLSIYLVSAAGHFFSTDHVATYLTAQSMVERHSLAIKPINDATRGRDGQYYGAFGVGQSIVSIPLYLTGKAVDAISLPVLKRYFGGVNLGDWGGTVPVFFVSLLNQLVTPLICVLMFLFCVRLGFTRTTSLVTTLIFGVSTTAWVYARDSFQHPLETLLLLSCVYILFAHKAVLRPKHALLAGLALAFGILTRINLIIAVPLVVAYVFFITSSASGAADPGQRPPRARSASGLGAHNAPNLSFFAASRGAFGYALIFLAPIFLVLAAILAINYLKFGTILTFEAPAQSKGFSTPLWLGLYGNLFSVGRSIFLYSPPTLLALFTFRPFYRAHRAEALLFLSIAVVYLLFYARYGFWDGGWAWGPRFLVATIPFLIIPTGYFFGTRQRMAFVGLLACLGVGVQILGVAINYDFVYWDWINMRLSPDNAFLFVPDLSPLPTHLRDVLQGRHIDLWLIEVYQRFGIVVFAATLAVPLLALAGAFVLLQDWSPPMTTPPAAKTGGARRLAISVRQHIRQQLPHDRSTFTLWWANLERRSLPVGVSRSARSVFSVLLLLAVGWALVRNVAYLRTTPIEDTFAYECYARAFWQGSSAVVDVPYTRACADPALMWWATPPHAYHTLPHEYPAPALAVFSLPLLAPFAPYSLTFMILMAAVVFAVTAYLVWCRLLLCAGSFALFVLVGGWATALARFDLVPGVLTMAALIAAKHRRWQLAYFVLAAGALLKIYPMLLVPILAIHQWRKTGRVPWQALTLFMLAIMVGTLPFIFLAPQNVLQPLAYNGLRPPQVESLPGSLVWLSGHVGQDVEVLKAYHSLSITGTQANLAVGIASVFLIMGVILTCWRAWHNHDTLGRSFVLGVLVTLCGSKLLSPQYLLWLFPVVAYVEGARFRWMLLALLTVMIFPYGYGFYTNLVTLPDHPFFMGAILSRNAILLTLTLRYLTTPAEKMKVKSPIAD